MSIYRVTSGDVSTFTIATNPFRSYVSSSNLPVTGSINVFPRRSSIERDVFPVASSISGSAHDDADASVLLHSVQKAAKLMRSAQSSLSSSFIALLTDYMNAVSDMGTSVRKSKVVDIVRFTPTTSFTKDTLRKLQVKDILNKYYRSSYPTAHWAYTNYNSLNFFHIDGKTSDQALLYPNINTGPHHAGYVSGTYGLSGSFSFDFYVNPRRTSFLNDSAYHAGTIFHLSSSYAVSLVSGSARDAHGRAAAFRIQLQLSHSADITPSNIVASSVPSVPPNDLIFLSDDNSLKLNTWHHVIIRWGPRLVNNGTGSFNIDGVDRGKFVVPSGTVAPRIFPVGSSEPTVLVVGAYYVGNNAGTSAQEYFFAADPALRDGLEELNPDTGVDEPVAYSLINQLNAELHDLAIKRYYMSDVDIATSASIGPSSIGSDVAFYVPPFFVHDSPVRRLVGAYGGIMQTPFFEVDGSTDDPFNIALAFGVGGHYINIENFLLDFASNVFPRCHRLTGSVQANATTLRSANDFLYDDPYVIRRNLLLLPCDDGSFVPGFSLLASESLRRTMLKSTVPSKYVDDLGNEDLSLINLDNMILESSLLFGGSLEDGTGGVQPFDGLVNELIGNTPEQPGLPFGNAYRYFVKRVSDALASGTYEPGVAAGAPLTIFQRTRDGSSNQVTFFDVSNIFYGNRIHPTTFVLTDSNVSGSSGSISITLRDDGNGNLYRGDCLSPQATWNSVGNIYYNEGIVVIKSPHLYFFGKDQYEMSFRGEQNVHVMKIDVIAPANQLNSSSNPNFLELSASGYPVDSDPKYVLIDGIYFHDDNFNVVAKAQLAQPILKRHGSRILFRTKIDF